MSTPTVTVIIPTYNRAYILDRAVQSVLRQTHADFELLIVDDASKDETGAYVHGLADPRVKYIRHEVNHGQCVAINTGIAAARGEFVACLDSDDEWLPTALEKQLAVFRSSGPDLGVVYMYTASLAPDGSIVPEFSSQLRGKVYREVLAQGYMAPSITLMVRRRCFDEIGGFDPEFRCYQDDDICFRLAKHYTVDFVPEVLAYVHQDAEASSRLMRNRVWLADGWWRLLTKHEADIGRECGETTLSEQFAKAGRMFEEAGNAEMAATAFARARKVTPGGKLRRFLSQTAARFGR